MEKGTTSPAVLKKIINNGEENSSCPRPPLYYIDYDDEEENEEEYEEHYNLNENFDEKEELEVYSKTGTVLAQFDEKCSVRSSSDSSSKNYQNTDYLDNVKMSKSQFYLQPSPTRKSSDQIDYDLNYLPNYVYDETFIIGLNNVCCFYSTNESKTLTVPGRLLLTNYRIVFLPYEKDTRLFEVDKQVKLFAHLNPLAIDIPFAFIYSIKGASSSSEKYRKLKHFLDPSSSSIREMLVKCKNFMMKSFLFYEKSNDLLRFLEALTIHVNVQNVIKNQVEFLVNSVSDSKKSSTLKAKSLASKRKSYFTLNDLQEDLFECECAHFMKITPGTGHLSPNNRFIIDMNMPFCAIPKNIKDILLAKRVVTNEANVVEFVFQSDMQNAKNATLTNTTKKPSKFSEFLNSSTKRNSTDSKMNIQFQPPILANPSYTNPFYENTFPIWSYTHAINGCSLVVVPDTLNVHDCDVLIKNYNTVLCEEMIKSEKMDKPIPTCVSAVLYSEYEFFKIKVPFNHEKISSSYSKLMDMCSFKVSIDYQKEYEANTFYSRLHNSKWLRNVSTLLSHTAKIINTLHLVQRNVFIEEYKNSLDCACILTSLVKLCLNSKYRTIVGFENLIQKEWSLVGHLFQKRLKVLSLINTVDSNLEPNNEQENQPNSNFYLTTDNSDLKSDFAPTFLLFLDCVFQLIVQYPSEFEFNEFYLINLWDYSCCGLSLTFNFNGINDLLNCLKTRGMEEPENLERSFELNVLFWQELITDNETNNIKPIFLNKNFQSSNNILIPCDKIYLLKFWSRCYLRWYESYYSYNLDQDEAKNCINSDFNFNLEHKNMMTPTRPAPPPPLPPREKRLEKRSEQLGDNIEELTSF